MEKDYTGWMPVKAEINNNYQHPLGYKERDIWVCSIGENIGHEEDGKNKDYSRPVLVLKAYNSRFCHVVPLSTTHRRGKFHYAFDGHTGKTSVALLSQSRALDTARFHDKIGYADKEDFDEIRKRISSFLADETNAPS